VTGRAKTAGALALLTAALPANLAVTGLALLRRRLAGPRHARASAARPRTVLVSGGKMTKALALARAFHRAGHRVVLVETARYRFTGHRFSSAVDAFHVVPEPGSPGYAQALLDVVRWEGVDVDVPVCSPAASRHDAEAKALLEPYCEVLHADAETVAMLDDKHAFNAAAAALGLPVPDHHRITDPAQVAALDFAALPASRYVLKSIPYDPVRRLDLTPLPRPTPAQTAAFAASLPISDAKPWVLQAFVEGQEYCTHSTARDGRLQVHCCCESSAFQLNYAQIADPEIEAWVRRFVAAHRITGQVSFDFIRGADGVARAIECNPRTHSAITMYHDEPELAAAYLEDREGTLAPRPGSRPTHWLYQELWRALSQRSLRPLATVLRGTDAIFDGDDPLPFLAVHHLQIPSLLLGNLLRGRDWVRIDFNIGKLVEPGGD
jgi:hypothetical protein